MRTAAREPEHYAPAASTTDAPPLPVRVGGSPAVAAVELQRAVGNAATARLLSRSSVQRTGAETAEAEAKPALDRIREINSSSWVGPIDELELQLQWSTIPDLENMLLRPAHWEEFSRSLQAGMDADKVESCTPLVRIWIIHELGGPDDAARLAELWGSMDDFLGTAKEYFPTWRTSVRYGMDPDDVAAVRELKEFLEDDVRAVAEDYLARNLAIAREERAELGLNVVPPAHDPTAARDELVRNAGLLRELVDLRTSLRDVAVGWRFEDGTDEEGAPARLRVPFAFDPGVEPDEPPEPGDSMLPWDTVDTWNQDLTDSILAVAATSPVLYGALEADRLDELDPSVPPEHVAATAAALLFELETNILETRENLDGSLDWRDMSPIIGDLTGGGLAGTVDWSEPFYESLVRDEVGDYETTRTLEEIGWMLPAVALIFAPVGWPALVAGGLLSAAEIARRYPRWDDLRAAAGAGATPDTELVDAGAAAAAEAEYALATVSGFLGIAGDMASIALGTARAGSALVRSPSERAAAFQQRHDTVIDGSPSSMAGLTEIFARTGRVGPDEYLPLHTRAHAQELKTIIRYAKDPAVKRIEVIASSSAGRSPDLVIDVLQSDGTIRRTRVEINTLTGTTAGAKLRGEGGDKQPGVADIVDAVRTKARDVPDGRRSQLAAPLAGVPAGGTLAIHLPYAGADATAKVAAAMAKLGAFLEKTPHVEAIEFYLPGAKRLRFVRDSSAAYIPD